ncbi:MAG: hypothetical protein D6675_12095 [Gemmatimonadetes bacterium]|nr:MAG: hypothetical protein D6675_12095 [Gemmatimonadota bacterium]
MKRKSIFWNPKDKNQVEFLSTIFCGVAGRCIQAKHTQIHHVGDGNIKIQRTENLFSGNVQHNPLFNSTLALLNAEC